MKNLLGLTVVFLSFVTTAIATPSNHQLATPKVIKKVSDSKISLTYELPCKRNDVVKPVLTNDDSGDRNVAVGIVYAADKRNCQPSDVPREFTTEVDLKSTGHSLESDSFIPMSINPSGNRNDYRAATLDSKVYKQVHAGIQAYVDAKSLENSGPNAGTSMTFTCSTSDFDKIFCSCSYSDGSGLLGMAAFSFNGKGENLKVLAEQ